MTDHNHDHAERVESLILRLRLAHDVHDRHALAKALGAAVFGCPGCAGDVILMLLDGAPRLDFIDRAMATDRLCDLHPAAIDPAGVAELFQQLSVADELELFGTTEGFPD
jgi:hypothetical protein